MSFFKDVNTPSWIVSFFDPYYENIETLKFDTGHNQLDEKMRNYINKMTNLKKIDTGPFSNIDILKIHP